VDPQVRSDHDADHLDRLREWIAELIVRRAGGSPG